MSEGEELGASFRASFAEMERILAAFHEHRLTRMRAFAAVTTPVQSVTVEISQVI